MPTVVGVRLRFSKTLMFDPAGFEPVEGDTVIVDTERGLEVGQVTHAAHEVGNDQIQAPLKPIVRVADEADLARCAEDAIREREALSQFRALVNAQNLDMKPIDVEYLFDGDKIVFYFSAEERVDFRDLVKDLASRFHARIDMRQVGVRDEARMVGGVGHCGQVLCCARMGGEFQPVSIRMAKEQDLPLNPLKISGLCGRLMCCLRYEFDAYKDYKSRAPKRGAIVETPAGLAKVTSLNTPKELVNMRLEDGTSVTVPLGAMSCGKGTGCPCAISREALDEASGPASAIAMAADKAAERAAEAAAEKVAEPRRERQERRDRPAASAEEPSARKRRRRGKPAEGEAGKKAEGTERAPEADSKQGGRIPRRKPEAAAKQEAPAAATDGAEKPKSNRRRRRRRPGGGGGTTPAE